MRQRPDCSARPPLGIGRQHPLRVEAGVGIDRQPHEEKEPRHGDAEDPAQNHILRCASPTLLQVRRR